MATARTSPTDPPSAAQLAAGRAVRFHQDGNALLTVEAVRTWLNQTGLALYLPRPDQLPVPAPSFVEATLGTATAEPTPDQLEQARGILARLIAEGACVPLNLLGVSGASGTDTPDFVCSPAVFSFLFTLRGNKAWKAAPVTSGPVKVSPLAVNTYELLAAKLTLSSYDLTTQLGKEITETAVLRALTELWQQLRVIPVPQTDGSPTLWELPTARFTKQIKAGANAGQPTALSALISLYLNQAIAATEDEVETFLSPLAPRSRLRSVVHDLIAARQLESIVVEGKTLVHIAGTLPGFDGAEAIRDKSAEDATPVAEAESSTPDSADGGRIRKFTPNPAAKLGTGLRSRPTTGTKPSFGGKRPFAGKSGPGGRPPFGRPGGDRERRPFDRDSRPPRPSFNKPWDEERSAKGAVPPPSDAGEGIAASAAGSTDRPAYRPKPAFGSRPGSGSRPQFRDRPERTGRDAAAGESRSPRPGSDFGGTRPFRGKPAFPPRERSSEQSGDAPRRTFSRPPATGRDQGDGQANFRSRPPRREFGGERAGGEAPRRPGSFPPRTDRGFGGPRKDGYAPRDAARPSFGEQRSGPPARRPFVPREENGRPPFRGGTGNARSAYGDRPRPESGSRFPSRPPFSKPGAPADGEAPRRTFRKFDAPRPPKPFGAKRPFDAARPPREGRPSPEGRRQPSQFAGKGGPFAKFANGNKPFRKPGKPFGSGGAPTPGNRKRPEDEA